MIRLGEECAYHYALRKAGALNWGDSPTALSRLSTYGGKRRQK
jgi:hypothetical protein